MRSLHTPFVVLAVAAFLAGCPGKQTSYAPASGSLAISPDGNLLYAANFDHGTLSVVDAASLEVVTTVKVGQNPTRVVAGSDGRVWVANRGSRSVSVVERGKWSQVHEVEVGAEPVGLALSADGETLLVTTQESGDVVALNTQTLDRRWTTHLGNHPRALAVSGNRVAVTHYKTGEVSMLDLESGTPEQATNLALPELVTNNAFGTIFAPGQVADLAVSPNGMRIYSAQVQARDVPIRTEEPDAYGGDGFSPLVVPAVAAGVGTIDAETGHVVPEVGGSHFGNGLGEADMPPGILASDGGPVFNVPSAAVVDRSGDWLFVAFQGSNNIAVVSTFSRHERRFSIPGVYGVADTGGDFPTGIAISPDNGTAFVHNAHSYQIARIERTATSRGVMDRFEVTDLARITEDPQWLTEEVRLGRRLFHTAVDPTVTNPQAGGVSCASCHPEGRDDGRTWLFSEGPRNTPLLTTGFLADTKPFHWAGEVREFHEFDRIVTERMGGQGLGVQQFDRILAFLESPAALQPDNPNVSASGLTDLQRQGKLLFEGKANCASCHAGQLSTDNLNHDVGTRAEFVDDRTGVQVSDLHPLTFALQHDFQTPSLRHVYTTGPYLHSGLAGTLEQRMDAFSSDEAHGTFRSLDSTEKSALLSYLETL